MKERTLKVTVGNTLLNKAAIENGVVTLFLIAMSEICDGMQEPVKIIGYADDWMILTSHKHEKTCELRIKKQCNKSPNWQTTGVFQYP
jgi:hypothetical protein